jgi:hypothetical protein
LDHHGKTRSQKYDKFPDELVHDHGQKQDRIGLEQISLILNATPKVVELACQDLVRSVCPTTGREGMAANRVLRCAILKQYRQLTYEELLRTRALQLTIPCLVRAISVEEVSLQ